MIDAISNGKYETPLRDHILVEFGDTKQASFYPQAKVMPWGNECNFSLRYQADIADAAVVCDGAVLKWTGKDKTAVCFYEEKLPQYGIIAPQEGLELLVVLDSAPPTNVLSFTLETKGLVFLYQGELTAEEKSRGAIRPENAVGSYAVYHADKTGGVYKAGNAFHIFRPIAFDKGGKKTYCGLKIDAGMLTVEIPKDFLDTAAYPVTVDPTFGYNTVGSSGLSLVVNQAVNYYAAPGSSGTVNKLYVYGKAEYANCNIKGVIWEGGSLPANIVTNGITPALVCTKDDLKWHEPTYSTKPSVVASTNYRLGLVADNLSFLMYYNAGSAPEANNFNYSGQSYASPVAWPNSNNADYGRWSVYAEYTATVTRRGNFIPFVMPGAGA